MKWTRILLVVCLAAGTGCFDLKKSSGGGQTEWSGQRRVEPRDVLVPDGYRVEVVARGLNMPTGVAFDDQGGVYVIEAGYSYGEIFTTARLLKLDGRETRVIAEGDHAPWTGVRFHDGAFYVAQGGAEGGGGRIVRITPGGKTDVLIDGLPSLGDHHTNGPAIHDGHVYFAVGTATNSGVVGTDNWAYGWLQRHPDFCDIPARDVTLAGVEYETADPRDPSKRVHTGAYVPYGTRTRNGQVIEGRLPANGCIMRFPLAGGSPELVAWGLRNPWGLAFSPEGRLFVTENQADVRGSRPIWGVGDLLWEIDGRGEWYGWPDFWAGRPVEQEAFFAPPGKEVPRMLLTKYPNVPPKPAAIFGVHTSADGLDFSRSADFGFEGEAFVAEFGDMAPAVGKTMQPVGYQVCRVDTRTGVIRTFAANRGGDQNAPASWLETGGLERPVDAKFSPDGRALYVVDFGVLTMNGRKPVPRQHTGVLWRITREVRP